MFATEQGLESSRHAPPRGISQRQQHGLDISSFESDDAHRSLLPPMPGLPVPVSNSSLQAMALRRMARGLSWHVEMEGEWLGACLTGRLKAALLAYVEALGQKGGLGERDLRILLGPVRDESDDRWMSGGAEVTHLAVGSSIGRGVSWKALGSLLDRGVDTGVGGKGAGEREEGEGVPNSWDEEQADTGCYGRTEPSLLEAPKLLFLPDLTHLSLARCSSPSWNSLLSPSVLPRLAQLTHLDLSFWPVPTLTPNSLFARVDSPMGSISYGGTNLYSAMDGDWREACSVLKRLGKGCRSLVWLGLEGCSDWWEALAYDGHHGDRGTRSRHWREDVPMPVADRNDEREEVKIRAIDWNGAWHGLSAINVGHAWAPHQYGSMEQDSISQLLEKPSIHQIRRWAKSELLIRSVEKRAREWRLQAGLKPVRFEKTPLPDIVARELEQSNGDLSRYI